MYSDIVVMKIAICFWGLARSMKYTIQSIQERIIKNFDNNNIPYKVFFHTYQVLEPYNNSRASETDIILDNNEYELLNADYISIDNQEIIKTKINLKSYRSMEDPWDTNYETMDNFILAMYSKKQLWKLVNESNESFTHYLFIRPDVLYLNDFDINWLTKINNNDIYIPKFHHELYNFNDRMALIKNKSIAEVYSNVFDHMLQYSIQYQLHSETFIRFILKRSFENINIHFIEFFFNRVRANGLMTMDTEAK